MPVQYDDILPPLTSEDKMLSGLCYPFWVAVPFFILASRPKREDPFLLFHALQGLAVGVLSTLLCIVGLLFLWISFSCLPTTYTMTAGFLGVVLLLGAMACGGLAFATSIFLGWQASSGRFLRILGVGDWCEARMATMLNLTSTQLRQLAIDRELVPEEKVVVIQAVSTPEQLAAEMERWAQPVGRIPEAQTDSRSWWGEKSTPPPTPTPPPPAQAAPAPPPPERGEARPWKAPAHSSSAPPPPEKEVKPWKAPTAPGPAPAASNAEKDAKPWRPPTATAPARPNEPEVKPWRPSPANTGPQAKPVSFPAVKKREAEEKPQKWWAPKERP